MMERYTARLRPHEEWDRLNPPPESLPHDPASAVIVVIEDPTGRIVARWFAYTTVALEGLWVAPDHRHHPGVAARLMQAMTAALVDRNVQMAVTLITDDGVARLAMRHGLFQVPGALWVLDLRTTLMAEG